MRAILAASATTTVLECALASRPRSHWPSRVLLRLNVGKAARAPWISIFRKYLLPRLVIPSRRGLPQSSPAEAQVRATRQDYGLERKSLRHRRPRQAQWH